MRHGIAAILAASLMLAPAVAHEFWIEPALYRVPPKSTIDIRLRVGANFEGQVVKRSAKRVVRFEALGPGGQRPVMGDDGAEPAGSVALDEPGLHIIVHQNSHAKTELEAAKFNAYLKDEGLDAIVKEREARGESQKPGREAYARYAKALVCVGADKGGEDRPVGLPLELVLEGKVCELKAGNKLMLKLLFEGKPLEGAQLTALSRKAPNKRIVTRTDKDGRAAFELDDAGVWLIAGVYMQPAPKALEADWESFWASITFEVAAAEGE